MKLSEKIQTLRNARGYSQEDLAAICSVSRQSISKWETDIALPETEKLIVLSNLFQVTIDVLLKDDLSLDGRKEVNICGCNTIKKEGLGLYEGIMIKESLEDETLLDHVHIHKIELWNTGGVPKYWTVFFFTSDVPDFPELAAKALIADPQRGGNWFIDFKHGNTKFIVFKGRILKYTIGNEKEKALVYNECKARGISDSEMNWSE